MNVKTAWLLLRVLRLGLWLLTVLYYLNFAIDRQAHLNPFGHLLTTTEMWMFSLPTVAIFVGFLELAMRERAGIPRPALGRNWYG